jgi:hypothetical protein
VLTSEPDSPRSISNILYPLRCLLVGVVVRVTLRWD